MLKNKVLVLGSGGLIGHQVYSYLNTSNEYDLYNISHKTQFRDDTILLQARNEKDLLGEVRRIKPKYIINCIGVLIRSSNEDPENAIFINAYMPHRLARLAEEINAKLVHISTDCVFSGNKTEPYKEDDEKDGRGAQGGGDWDWRGYSGRGHGEATTCRGGG